MLILGFVALVIGGGELKKIAGSPIRVPILGAALLALTCPVVSPIGGWPIRYSVLQSLDRAWLGPAICLTCSAIGTAAAVGIARGKRGWLWGEFAGLWLAAPLAAIVLLKLPEMPREAVDWKTPVLLCLVPIWVGDTLAIFAGRAFGKHLLAPKISPKKTVEGGIANLLGCIGAAISLSLLLDQPILVGILTGLATGTLGQVGDLLESAMKRSADLKDSGALLPGHGGLLDRIDSILLSAPTVALIFALFGNNFAAIGMATG